MVKPAFENLRIDCWVHPGKLGLVQPSVCLFHHAAQVGAPLLEALTELHSEPLPAKRTLTFSACSRTRALGKLKLLLVAESTDLRVMNIRPDADAVTITMTAAGYELIRAALAAWLAGAEDFGVAPRHSALKPKELGRLDRESGELWFWGPIYSGP